MASAPKYEVVKICWIDQPDPRSDTKTAPMLFRPNEKTPTTVRYAGWPNSALKPLDDEAKRRVEIVEQHQKAHIKLPATVEEYDAEQKKAAKAKPVAESKAA